MANQKEIRTRIVSVKNTQKITRAMKMVAGARLTRAQSRIQELRPYAQETARVLRSVAGQTAAAEAEGLVQGSDDHHLLAVREESSVLLLVLTSDRGLCGAFNSGLLRRAERQWHALEDAGKTVKIFVVGRKGRDYLARRNAPVVEYFDGVWDDLGLPQAHRIARAILKPYMTEEVDAIHILFNEFKSAMTQLAVEETLFPLSPEAVSEEVGENSQPASGGDSGGFIFEPNKKALLDVLVPMYVEVTLLRALYESQASELGARMTAMDSATNNANDMIDSLTLSYNRARQAAITTELMEIIGGSEALNG